VHHAGDQVEPRVAADQTVVTAVVANRGRRAGIAVAVQQPDRHAADMAYWQATGQARDTPLETARACWSYCMSGCPVWSRTNGPRSRRRSSRTWNRTATVPTPTRPLTTGC
jgi:hypothetical protein